MGDVTRGACRRPYGDAFPMQQYGAADRRARAILEDSATRRGCDARQQPLLAVGQAADVDLLLAPKIHYPLQPQKPGGPVSYGGLIGIEVREAATYRIALSSGA